MNFQRIALYIFFGLVAMMALSLYWESIVTVLACDVVGLDWDRCLGR